MGNAGSQSVAVAAIAAMITPALLLLGSASLVASALTRMARVVDRADNLAAVAHGDVGQPRTHNGSAAFVAREPRQADAHPATLHHVSVWRNCHFHLHMPIYALDRALDDSLSWLPVLLAVIAQEA
jgi:hypothetical protein